MTRVTSHVYLTRVYNCIGLYSLILLLNLIYVHVISLLFTWLYFSISLGLEFLCLILYLCISYRNSHNHAYNLDGVMQKTLA